MSTEIVTATLCDMCGKRPISDTAMTIGHATMAVCQECMRWLQGQIVKRRIGREGMPRVWVDRPKDVHVRAYNRRRPMTVGDVVATCAYHAFGDNALRFLADVGIACEVDEDE